ncbi:MAG: SMP-30/gluconolactonase/LRE family protein [Mycobacterium sp.]|nr:SMP-30/gluconolactonase/LRE family protein [Mycobacterium sp.]
MRNAERVSGPCAYHAEGPFWDSRGGRLLYLDVLAANIIAIDSTGRNIRYTVPSRAATVIRRRTRGGFIVATEHGLVVTDDSFTTFEHSIDVIDDPAIRTNDGGCDPLGGFVIGTMAYDEQAGRGTVYRVSADGRVAELLSPVTISNGVQWSADGTRVFYIDTPTRRVDVLDVDPATGTWSRRRVHLRIEDTAGFPDGMAIDEEDGLWIALWGGGALNHYDHSGQLVETIAVPGVSQVSSCAFGGDDGRTLFITTSRKGLPTGQEADAGAIFSVPTSVRGAFLSEFAG